jgi:hypothetical protein
VMIGASRVRDSGGRGGGAVLGGTRVRPPAYRRSMTFDAFAAAVSALLVARYQVTWADACGESEPLRAAFEEGEAPERFVERWAGKYGLEERGAGW